MMRRSLGRGLDALMESSEAIAPSVSTAGEADGGLTSVALDRIVPSPLQPRHHFDAERLQELARAIQSQGVIEPLIVRMAPAAADGAPRYELVAGERRLRAARAAGLGTVPVIIRQLDDHAALEMSLVENLARQDLNAAEEARAFSRLSREFGLSHDEIAGRIGKSRPYVSNTVRLLDLAPSVLEMIDRGELSAGQARPLLALPSGEAQVTAARRILSGQISARGAERMAGEARRARVARGASAADPNVAALAEGMQRSLKRKVRIVRARGRRPGRIEIEYYGADDLTALAAALGAGQRGAFAS